MARTSPAMAVVPVAVIGSQYCCPYNVDLAVVRKVLTISDGNFVVTDSNGNLIFKVKGSLFSLRNRRVLVDANGKPVVTLRQKILTTHSRWQAFGGDSTNMRDLIFTAKTSSIIQLKTKLDVFLAHNHNELVTDFTVQGSWLQRSCTIYAGESTTSTVAQMHKKTSIQSVLLGKDKFMVTICPNIDYAFILALIVILDDINGDN